MAVGNNVYRTAWRAGCCASARMERMAVLLYAFVIYVHSPCVGERFGQQQTLRATRHTLTEQPLLKCISDDRMDTSSHGGSVSGRLRLAKLSNATFGSRRAIA